MSIEAYINPDFGWTEKFIFLLASFLGVFTCVILVIGISAFSRSGKTFYERSHTRVQEFYELIISGTSIMSFSCAYVILNHIYSKLQGQSGIFSTLWGNWKDFMLLLLICLSCVLNTVLDRLIIPLKFIDKTEKASVRMLGMFYAIIILVYLNFMGDESEYNPVMMYYLGLLIGRFVYFDASFSDFIDAVKSILKHLPLLALGLTLTGALSWFGFDSGYLLERNYFIVGIFYTQLFMLVSVFLLHHSHLLDFLVRKPRDAERTSEPHADAAYSPEEEYEDYEEYDNYDDYR